MVNGHHPDSTLTMAEEAHKRLESMIVTLELPPGSKWSEEALAKELGLGRTPIREALQKLSGASLLNVVPRQGVVISEIDLVQQLRVLEFRKEVEIFVASRAARRASTEERAALEARGEALMTSDTGDVRQYLDSLFETNSMLVDFANNIFARNAIEPLLALSRRFYFKYHIQLDNLALVGELHGKRALAVASGSQRSAIDTTEDLLDVIKDYTDKIFAETCK